jgi:hypothetical protein
MCITGPRLPELWRDTCIDIHIYIYSYIYMYIWRERERETNENTTYRIPQSLRPSKPQTIRPSDLQTPTLYTIWRCGPICTGPCTSRKCRKDFRKDARGREPDRCEACQYPCCEGCGVKHKGPKPVPAIVKRWLCKKCKK